MNSLRKRKDAPSMKYFDKPKEEEKVWEIRESGLGSTAFVPGLPLAWPGWEDSAVPPDRVGDYLRDLRKLLDKHEYIASLYGHLGQGCIHCRITFDLFTRKGVENCLSFLDDATSLVVSYNGSLSGERGDGQARAFFLPKMYGPELIRAFEEFKAIWDPQYLMNPGKVVNPYRPDENLRLGPRYRPWEPRTYFQFPQDQGSYSRAALRCVGVGKCRAVENTFMCPSFLVTREEKDTTRGRAHLLFEMCHKGIINSGWRSQAVNESLDLCLSCKACKLECPINVDMATLKAEFRAHHYRSRIKPRVYYSMGLIGTWARLGSKMPLLANFVSQIPGLRDLVKEVAGVAPQRKLPKFAHQTFGDWYRKNRDTSLQHRPQVVLFPDMFNNYFLPHTLEATYLLLNHWGYDVVLPSGELTDARPLIHYGWLKRAQKEIKLALGQLEPFLKEEIPVLFCEPSTASIFRDEAEEFFPKDENVKKMKSLALLPVVRRAPKDTYLVADGFSCRTQIEEGTGCKALHFAEFLLLAYQKNGIDIRLGRESGRQILERVEVV